MCVCIRIVQHQVGTYLDISTDAAHLAGCGTYLDFCMSWQQPQCDGSEIWLDAGIDSNFLPLKREKYI